MDKFGVQLALEGVAEARAAWAKAQTSFTANVDTVLPRLLHEAVANRMSVDQIARYSGLTPKQVRERMRRCGLDPKMGAVSLSKAAASALESNAALLGVDPLDMDLLSPLAYLPMGDDLKRFLETEANRGVKELPEESTLTRRQQAERILTEHQEISLAWTPDGGSTCSCKPAHPVVSIDYRAHIAELLAAL